MSLQGIFDPVVRAYFAGNGGGNSGGGSSGGPLVFDFTGHISDYSSLDVIPADILGVDLYRMSEVLPSEDDFRNGCMVFPWPESTMEAHYLTRFSNNENFIVGSIDGFPTIVSASGTLVAISLPEESAKEIGVRGGLYFNIGHMEKPLGDGIVDGLFVVGQTLPTT